MDSKPLPAIPSISLSTDAREHRTRLIRHLLSETLESVAENGRESWVQEIEESLDQLGDCITQHDWLSGIRRGHKPRPPQQPSEPPRLPSNTSHSSHSTALESEDQFGTSPLKQIQDLVAKPSLPSADQVSNRLVLCLTPLGSRIAVPAEDSGFDLIPANLGCKFKPGVFLVEDASSIMYGLNEWETIDSGNVRPVGGTFTFKGVSSPIQHHSLSKVLRMAIYVHLSLLLEQCLMLDSNVPLMFPRPKPPRTVSAVSNVVSKPTPKSHHFLPNGLLSFFSKRNPVRLSVPTPARRSLDVPTPETPTTASPLRRFSFISEGRSSFRSTATRLDPPLSDALQRVEQNKTLLSTSPGIVFPPPALLVRLAEKEKFGRKLKGDERTGLQSLLGWDGREARGKGMCGVTGFVRMQEISVLVSSHAPPPSQNEDAGRLTQCEKPVWRTYRYHCPGEDLSLGDVLSQVVSEAEEDCTVKGCQAKRGKHSRRFIHNGIQIMMDLADQDGECEEVWVSCSVCGGTSDRKLMSDGTFLLSFGKLLELLIYSPRMTKLSQSICVHTESRFNLVRHFGYQSRVLSFRLFPIEDIFELRVPRLQIVRGQDKSSARNSFIKDLSSSSSSGGDESSGEKESDLQKKTLRREIKRWWEGVADHIDKLEEIVTSDDLHSLHKALPRLPSEDDAYDGFDMSPRTSQKRQSPISGLPLLPSSTPVSPSASSRSQGDYFGSVVTSESQSSSSTATPGTIKPRIVSSTSLSSTSSTPGVSADAANLLSNLRQTFHGTEQSLYSQLSQTPVNSLNDVRRAFLSAARGADRRLQAWQKKHLPPGTGVDKLEVKNEPEWWNKSCHVVPGGDIIVREDDWGSIIAFTMSTTDYYREMASMSLTRAGSTTTGDTSSSSSSMPMFSPLSTPSSFFAAATGYKLFRTSALSQPDPDQEDVIWHEPEAYSAVISRKEHPRDPTGLLSLREVLRQKSPTSEGGSGIISGSRFASLSSATPPSAWSKPEVQMSMDAAGGKVIVNDGGSVDSFDLGRKLLEIDSASSSVSGGERERSRPTSALSWTSERHANTAGDIRIGKWKAPSIVSFEPEGSDDTVGPEEDQQKPEVPPKDTIHSPTPVTASETTSSFAALTSGLTHAMRFVMNHNGGDIYRPHSPASSRHHGLLSSSSEVSNIDERPHIKYDWTIGKRLKFSCTVYYAKQFDSLRKRCGVDDVFLKSLSRSANWAAEGGKSKSNFWKTADDRFIIKTLVNAWNVADLQVLIELAPSYFKYMDSTANKPTVLAKLVGFYTIEIRNLETGTVQSKADLLVMENLFYAQKVIKTFDLKGIQGRKVKPSTDKDQSTVSKTLFDGEWIEGQQQTLTLVRPHSKMVLREAVKNDADFLAKSNIMDYSLLVGVDEERKQIACGLVDTIGSYTFAKTLEYKAKQGLNAGKEVTVIPPAEYQERFVNALDMYFLACPDKWSRRMDIDSRTISDPNILPSVL